jgi:hypothetical protein
METLYHGRIFGTESLLNKVRKDEIIILFAAAGVSQFWNSCCRNGCREDNPPLENPAVDKGA